MSLLSGIVTRPGSRKFYARLRVPDDLRAVLGKSELWTSLRTTDNAEAKKLGTRQLAEWHELFAQLRARKEPTEAEVREMVWARYVALIEGDERFRLIQPDEGDLDEVWRILEREYVEHDLGAFRVFEMIRDGVALDQAERAERLKVLRAEAARGHSPSSLEEAHQAAVAAGIGLDKTSLAARKLSGAFARAELEALRRADERDAGDWTGAPADPIVKAPVGPSTTAPKGEKLMELFDQFRREKEASKGHDTWGQDRGIIRRFSEHVGTHVNVGTIGRKHVRTFKAALFNWPTKVDQVAEFKGLSFAAVIAKNASLQRPVIGDKTKNRYLSALSAFCEWLTANDHLPLNPVRGQFLEKSKERKRMPLTPEHMRTLFTSPLYTGFQRERREHLAGNETTRDWRFWLPLLAAFTGARLGELAQLHVADIREMHGVWIIHVTEEGEAGKSLKTAGSARIVPLHSELVKLGFLTFHAAAAISGETRLFANLKPDARGFHSGVPSKFFGAYLKHVGIKKDASLTIHSFRHATADAFRRAGYLDESFGPLLGHTKSSTTGKYGIVAEGPLLERVRMIEAISYPGLDLKHLYA